MKMVWYELHFIGLMITIIFGCVHLFIISVIVRKRLSITLNLFRKVFINNIAHETTGGTTATMQTTANIEIKVETANKAKEGIAIGRSSVKRERIETMEDSIISEKRELEKISNLMISEMKMKIEEKSELQMEISEVKMADVEISEVKIVIDKIQSPDEQNLETEQNTNSANNDGTETHQSLSPAKTLKKDASLLSTPTSTETVGLQDLPSSPPFNIGGSCATLGSDLFQFVGELIGGKNVGIIDEKTVDPATPNLNYYNTSNSIIASIETYSDINIDSENTADMMKITEDYDSTHEFSLAILESVTTSNYNDNKDETKQQINTLRIFTPQKRRSKSASPMSFSANQYPFQLKNTLKKFKSNIIPRQFVLTTTSDRAFSAEYSFAHTNNEYYVPSVLTAPALTMDGNTTASILDSTGSMDDRSDNVHVVGGNSDQVLSTVAEHHPRTYKLVDKGKRISRILLHGTQHEYDVKYKKKIATLHKMKSMKRTVDQALFGSIACIAVASYFIYICVCVYVPSSNYSCSLNTKMK